MKNFLIPRMLAVMRALSQRRVLPVVADAEPSGAWASIAESPLWARRRWLRLFGWPGIAGAGLLAMCTALYLSGIQPAQVKLNEVQQGAISIQERVKHAAKELNHNDLSPQEQLAAFYRIFPKEKDLLPWLEKIFSIAQTEGVRLDQGEYRVTRDKVGRLVRFQMTLPVRSEYTALRKYLNAIRAEIPIIAMEHLQFERQKVGDPEVEAKIKLAIYLEHES